MIGYHILSEENPPVDVALLCYIYPKHDNNAHLLVIECFAEIRPNRPFEEGETHYRFYQLYHNSQGELKSRRYINLMDDYTIHAWMIKS